MQFQFYVLLKQVDPFHHRTDNLRATYPTKRPRNCITKQSIGGQGYLSTTKGTIVPSCDECSLCCSKGALEGSKFSLCCGEITVGGTEGVVLDGFLDPGFGSFDSPLCLFDFSFGSFEFNFGSFDFSVGSFEGLCRGSDFRRIACCFIGVSQGLSGGHDIRLQFRIQFLPQTP